jgi:putative FmdB family regulatory protein
MMPLYEYYCPVCEKKFELLRPMSRAGEPAVCPEGHDGAKRVVSVFSAVTKGAEGDLSSLASECSTCSTGECGTCSIG